MRRRFMAALALVAPLLPSFPCGGVNGQPKPGHISEETLGGLRPGRDTIERASRLLGKRNVELTPSADSPSWMDVCNRQILEIKPDSEGIIQEVITEPFPSMADCDPKSYSRRVRARFGTGRGLVLRDRCDRVRELYGTPDSETPLVDGKNEIRRLVYRFDRKGTKMSLILEATCGSSSQQVDKIRLFASQGSASE